MTIYLLDKEQAWADTWKELDTSLNKAPYGVKGSMPAISKVCRWFPPCGGIQRLAKFGGDVGCQTLLVSEEIGEEQVAADALGDGGEAALHARHVADRNPEADKAGRVLDVDVPRYGALPGVFSRYSWATPR